MPRVWRQVRDKIKCQDSILWHPLLISSPDILTEEAVDPPMESHSLLASSLMMLFQFPVSYKDYACSSRTTCHLCEAQG